MFGWFRSNLSKEHFDASIRGLHARLTEIETKENTIMAQDDDLATAVAAVGTDLTNISNGVAQVLKDLAAAQQANPDPAVAKAITDLSALHTQAVGVVASLPADAQPTTPPEPTPAPAS